MLRLTATHGIDGAEQAIGFIYIIEPFMGHVENCQQVP
jgi:hypothetical protein